MSATPGLLDALRDAAGWAMLHLVWIGLVVGLVASALRRLLRGATPEARYGAALACLAIFSASPFAMLAWDIRRDPPAPSATVARSLRSASTGSTSTPAPILRPDRRSAAAPRPSPTARPGPSRWLEPALPYLPVVWLVGSSATLALLATGLIGVERLRGSSVSPTDVAIAARCDALAGAVGIARSVGVAVSDRIAGPVLLGIVRPMILLPPSALSGWSPEQIEMALLHELAHLRRGDNLVNLLQRLAEALLFFHPVTWWLSSWARLERESCCDRFVVDRTGRPHSYAQFLASLVVPGSQQPLPVSSIDGRPLLTRIRRILDMEDRSMRLTLPEGFGLLAAAVVAASMAIAARAETPSPDPDEAARRTLERLVEDVLAMPDSEDSAGERDSTMVRIARSQLELGDRAAAIETLGHLVSPTGLPRLDPADESDDSELLRLDAQLDSVGVLKDAGDLDGARAALDRVARLLPAIDPDATRSAFERFGEEIEREAVLHPDGYEVVGDDIELNDEPRVLIDEWLPELSAYVIDRRIALGDLAEARSLIRRCAAMLDRMDGPSRPVMTNVLGGYLVRAGDPSGGRELIDRARRDALAIDDPGLREFTLSTLAGSLADLGDLDGAFALVAELSGSAQQSAIGEILDGLATEDRRVVWYDPSGIKIAIGDPSLTPEDPESARVILPKIAGKIRALDDPKVRARTLAVVAHLQARAGDFDGAMATARSIPDLKRSDDPEPIEGYYDAVKPATYALIAGVQAEGGDDAAASATFAQAERLAHAVEAEDQRLIAQIVIAQQHADAGQHAATRRVVAEALPTALEQPEPRRSRVLGMLAEAQVEADDDKGALRTIDAIREYPGIEKARALNVLAHRRERSGDAEVADGLRRRAIACLRSDPPEGPPPGPSLDLNTFSRNTFVDPGLEIDPSHIASLRGEMLRGQLIQIGDAEAAIREVEALPVRARDYAFSQVVQALAHRGDLDAATAMTDSFASDEARLRAIFMLAYTLADQRSKR